jgi:hypothetical protein
MMTTGGAGDDARPKHDESHPLRAPCRALVAFAGGKRLRPVSGLASVSILKIDPFTPFPSCVDSGLGCVLAYRCRGSAGFEPASRFTRVEHLIKGGLYTALAFLAFCLLKGLSGIFVNSYTRSAIYLKNQIRKSLNFS